MNAVITHLIALIIGGAGGWWLGWKYGSQATAVANAAVADLKAAADEVKKI
jgi:uncharacterized membrane protein YfbV (UPF0208 family)